MSRATVSYVLNGRADIRIKDSTRQRVMEAARRLGYQPSPAGRALRTGRGDIVLVLVPDWDSTGEIGRLLQETGRQLAKHGLACLRYEGAQWQGKMRQVLGMVSAAAVVTLEPLSEDDAAVLRNSGTPEVPVWLVDSGDRRHTSRIGQDDLVWLQLEHLVARGYEDIVFVGVDDPRHQAYVRSREVAVEQFAARQRVRARLERLPESAAASADRVAEWAAWADGPVGVVAYSDVVGLHVLGAATRAGLLVPDHLGIIGTDDSDVARYSDPPLTSVRFDLMGEASALTHNVCTALGVATDPPSHPDTAVELIPRQSTDNPASHPQPKTRDELTER